MITIDEDLLEAPTRVASGARRGFRFTLTSEKNRFYLSLEMPVSEMAKRLNLAPDAHVKFSFLSAEKAKNIEGFEDTRYLILRGGNENDTKPKARGAVSRGIRIATYEITEEQADGYRTLMANGVEPVVIEVTGAPALAFPMPDIQEVEGE